MIFVWKFSPLAWTWYVFTGTFIMLFISIFLPYLQNRFNHDNHS
jgi:low affinity Fe/Cu permease